jgi:putative redox protein
MADHTAKVIWQNRGLLLRGMVDENEDLMFDVGRDEESETPQEGNSPMGLMLAGLAGCTAMDVISILKKKRQSITALEVAVEGFQLEEHPRMYHKASIVYRVKGKDIDEAAVDRAIELSKDKYCPANAMFKAVAEVDYRYEIINED